MNDKIESTAKCLVFDCTVMSENVCDWIDLNDKNPFIKCKERIIILLDKIEKEAF